jgi:hypothetical protein
MAGLQVTVQSASATEPFGSITVGPLTVTGTIVPVVLGPTLASGVNTITVPSGASGFVLVPPSTNTNTIQLKGVSGDTGLSLPKASFSVYTFDTAAVPANFVLTCGGTVGLSQLVFF